MPAYFDLGAWGTRNKADILVEVKTRAALSDLEGDHLKLVTNKDYIRVDLAFKDKDRRKQAKKTLKASIREMAIQSIWLDRGTAFVKLGLVGSRDQSISGQNATPG